MSIGFFAPNLGGFFWGVMVMVKGLIVCVCVPCINNTSSLDTKVLKKKFRKAWPGIFSGGMIEDIPSSI